MSQNTNPSSTKLLRILLISLIIYLGLGIFFRPPQATAPTTGQINFTTSKTSFDLHEPIIATILNNTESTITIPNNCPFQPFSTQILKNGQWETITSENKLPHCPNTEDYQLAPNESLRVTSDGFTNSIYKTLGFYKLHVEINGKTYESNQFEIRNQGTFGYIWNTLFYQPIYNILLALISIMPGKDLGLAIIILTIIIRTILLIPSTKALKAQSKLQNIQPHIDEIKKTHASDQHRQAQEIMALYKQHKVSPFGGCLPLLIQFPVLIALFYVIQSGLNPDNFYLLYSFFQSININSINTNFFNILELTQPNIIVLPVLVGFLQYLQLAVTNKKKNTTDTSKPKLPNEMEMANKIMKYVLPVMIAMFTATVPAGVGLYWGFSTLYGIGQQIYVNKSLESNQTKISEVKLTNKQKKAKYKKNAKNSNTTTAIETTPTKENASTNEDNDDKPIKTIRI